jgi:predicted secreted protein
LAAQESRLNVALAAVRVEEAVSDLSQLPDELTLRQDEVKTIDLPSLAGAGYVWIAHVDDEAVAEVSTRFQAAEETPAGARTFNRSELLTLRGRGAGTTRVHLAQQRTWEKGVRPEAAHSLAVNVVARASAATGQGGTR